jgi:hypothetical protein
VPSITPVAMGSQWPGLSGNLSHPGIRAVRIIGSSHNGRGVLKVPVGLVLEGRDVADLTVQLFLLGDRLSWT